MLRSGVGDTGSATRAIWEMVKKYEVLRSPPYAPIILPALTLGMTLVSDFVGAHVLVFCVSEV
jgi:hypothetical protein